MREACGISHDRQVLRIARIGEESGLKNAETGEAVPFQRSLTDPDSGFVELGLGALSLAIVETEKPSSLKRRRRTRRCDFPDS